MKSIIFSTSLSFSPVVAGGCSASILPFARRVFSTRAGNQSSSTNKRDIDEEKKTGREDKKAKTGILMLNMGGPESTDQVQPFLTKLFTDTDIMKLPFQSKLGPWIAKRRTPSVSSKYQEIGGGSPILNWTRKQGSLLTDQLNSRNPSTGPHKFYVGFRYARPLLHETLSEIAKDGVDRVVAFSQYPQYSCSTTGSSLNELAAVMTDDKSNDELRQALRGVSWSIIDRWSLNTGLIDSFTDMIERVMKERLPKDLNATQVMLLFSAHSLPMYVVARGDTYPTEVASTVMAVMSRLAFKYPYRLVWQSKVGPLPWMSPYTDQVIRSYAKKGIKNFVVIPIAFVNEHIETLHELDIEYGKDLMKELKVDNILRIPAPNIHPAFIEGLYQEVVKHLSSGEVCSPQLRVTCPHCTNPSCWTMRSWLKTLSL